MGTAAARFSDGLRRLSSLQRQHRPLLEAAHLIQSGIWPAALYGLEGHVPSAAKLDQLRTGAAKALLGERSSMSPHFAVCCLTPRISDPVVYLMSQSIGALRRMLLLLPDLGATWLRNAAALAQTSSRVIGPASALAKLLRDNQWTIQTSGVLKGPGHWRVDVRCSSTAAIRRACQGAWLEGLESRVGHRNGLARVDCPCPTTMASVATSFPGWPTGPHCPQYCWRVYVWCSHQIAPAVRLSGPGCDQSSFRSVAAMGPERHASLGPCAFSYQA